MKYPRSSTLSYSSFVEDLLEGLVLSMIRFLTESQCLNIVLYNHKLLVEVKMKSNQCLN